MLNAKWIEIVNPIENPLIHDGQPLKHLINQPRLAQPTKPAMTLLNNETKR